MHGGKQGNYPARCQQEGYETILNTFSQLLSFVVTIWVLRGDAMRCYISDSAGSNDQSIV